MRSNISTVTVGPTRNRNGEGLRPNKEALPKEEE
jgi:hypothetical protein